MCQPRRCYVAGLWMGSQSENDSPEQNTAIAIYIVAAGKLCPFAEPPDFHKNPWGSMFSLRVDIRGVSRGIAISRSPCWIADRLNDHSLTVSCRSTMEIRLRPEPRRYSS